MPRIVWAIALIMLFAGSTIPAAQNGNDLFQQALSKERAAGQLEEAIQIYQRILKQFAADRALAAKALLQMGRCYERLGSTEAQNARSAYDRLLREYVDQRTSADEARARLAALTRLSAALTGIVTRQVWTTNSRRFFGNVSADGRYVAFYPPSGDLVLHDFVDGKDRPLLNLPHPREGAGTLWSVFAPNARQVAYTWFNGSRYDLRVIGVDGNGSETPRVLYANDDVDWIGPYDWSADGKWIAVQVHRHDRTAQIGLVSPSDGTLRVLRSVEWQGSTRMAFSPDGEYLAFDLPADGGTGMRDIFLLASDGSRQIPAVIDPSNDLLVGWAPDGRHLLFMSDGSDRSGSMGLWSLAIRGGKPQGAPVLVKPDFGNNQLLLGLTRSGALYFSTRLNSSVLSIASVDVDAGAVLAAPPVEQINGGSLPAWAPDGKFLAYMSNTGRQGAVAAAKGDELVAVAVRTLETGQTRELHPRLAYFSWPRWSPDGRSLIGPGTDSRGREGIFRIDAQTGHADALAVSAEAAFLWPQWLPDGRRIIYVRTPLNLQGDRVIVERNAESGQERELVRNGEVKPIAVSPDGRRLAYTTYDPTTKRRALMLLPLEGGPSVELLRPENPAIVAVVGWTPDSRSVIFANAASESWRISVDGGQPCRIDPNNPRADGYLQVHPDGRRVVFEMSTQSPPQVWVLENFLPAASTAAGASRRSRAMR